MAELNRINHNHAWRYLAMLDRINPQPPPGPETGETILGLRTQADMYKLLKDMSERLARLERGIREQGHGAIERTG